MSEAKGNQEPSMEEILASIRRIISEDNGPAAAVPAAESEPAVAEAMDDVLELTEFAEEPPPPPVVQARTPEPEPEPEPTPVQPVRSAPPDDGRLVSDSTAAMSAAALSAIGDRLRRKLAADTPVGAPGVTIEDIIRDLLRPLLRDWLDNYLPDIVERLVAEEVRRLGRDAAEGRH